jgi:hypothetical protein
VQEEQQGQLCVVMAAEQNSGQLCAGSLGRQQQHVKKNHPQERGGQSSDGQRRGFGECCCGLLLEQHCSRSSCSC